jgi:hypothetical protein
MVKFSYASSRRRGESDESERKFEGRGIECGSGSTEICEQSIYFIGFSDFADSFTSNKRFN